MYSSPEHIGFLYVGIVGVKTDQYAQCLRAVNYLEPANTPKEVIIDDIMYADDGAGFDLAANDGILTAVSLTRIGDHARPVAVGEIRHLPEALFICAASFRFKDEAARGNRTIISTRAEWIPCEKLETGFSRFCKESKRPGLLVFYGAGLTIVE